MGQSQIWDWDNCVVSWVVPTSSNNDEFEHDRKLKVIIRSFNAVSSEYKKKDVELRYMLVFDVEANKIKPPEEENYLEPLDNKVKRYGQERTRWVIRIGNDRLIWQWKQEDKTIESSEVYGIYQGTINSLDHHRPFPSGARNFFNVVAYDDNAIGKNIVPVVYQPAIDSWKNFVREVHCHISTGREGVVEVTILFNNEALRRHKIVNRLYEWFRSWFYGRTIDVETFDMVLKDDVPELFDFPFIYSGKNDIVEDSIHIDKRDVNIKYYYGNIRHPIIFINTANHAMAEHDANHRLWKWEYIAWQKDTPIVFGTKSREEIDKEFRPKFSFLS